MSKLVLFLISTLSVVSLLIGVVWAVLLFIFWDKVAAPQEQAVSIVAVVGLMVSPLMAGFAQEFFRREWFYPTLAAALLASLPAIWLAGTLLLDVWGLP